VSTGAVWLALEKHRVQYTARNINLCARQAYSSSADRRIIRF